MSGTLQQGQIKDHLGNVRQVLRGPEIEVYLATMETESADEEGQHFRQLDESRQSDLEHNVTAGGDKVAWLNADRGRILGPNASRQVWHGETINLSVHGKYENPKKKRRTNKASLLTAGARQRILTDIGELSREVSGNPVTVLQLVDLIAKDLQTKKSPEAYLYYALYSLSRERSDSGILIPICMRKARKFLPKKPRTIMKGASVNKLSCGQF